MFCCAASVDTNSEAVITAAEASHTEVQAEPEPAEEEKQQEQVVTEKQKEEVAMQEPEQEAAPNTETVPTTSNFEVELDVTQDSLGLVADIRGGTMNIAKIEGGAVVKYNQSVAAEKQVQLNDFIVEVNGKSDPESMAQELTVQGALRLKVQRVVPFKISLSKALL